MRDFKNSFVGKEAMIFKVNNGLFDILPVGVLGKNCTNCYLKGALSWPPVLRAKVIVEIPEKIY